MLYRLLTKKGLAWMTFTPLMGMSEVVTAFLENEEKSLGSKHYVQAGWKDVPHLDEEARRKLAAGTPSYQVKARTAGEPSLGVGAIYPLAESEIVVADFPIPEGWPRVFGMDVGWNCTAIVWAALNPASGVIYLYSEHYQGQAEPEQHAQAIRARGGWINGVIDPACLGSSHRRAHPDGNLQEPGATSVSRCECRRGGNYRSVEPAAVGTSESDGELVALVAGVSQVPPRRQG
jgi:hypothetical protein